MSKYFRWAELPARKDVYTYEGTTRWGNHDVYPIPKKERTYGVMAYYSYYIVGGVSVTGFTAGSAYVASGLSVGATIGAILLGSVIAGLNSFLGGQVGVDKSLGYTMMTRATFGLWGCNLPLFASLLGNVIFCGIQAYYGGQAITLILGAVIPQFHNLANTLPASAAITTQDLIGFFIYFAFFIPIVLFVPIYKLQKWMYPSTIFTGASLLGVLGWIIHQNGGTGPLVSSPIKLSSSGKAFIFLQCVSSTAAVWGGAGDRMSDWTRFAKSKHSAVIPMLTGLPIFLTLTSVVGALATSAFYEYYQEEIWTPIGMLLHVQQVTYTPACRAGTFFAGIGLLSSQLYINIVQNTLAFGMDFAGIFPKYMSMKRGAMTLIIVSMAINPWRFLNQAAIFIEVYSVFAVFAAVDTAILNADYWVVRRRKWKIPDLYKRDSIYWYTGGWNIRSVAVWIIAIVPTFPGFVHSVMGSQYMLGADYKMYQMSFFIGYPLAFGLHVLAHKIWPPTGLGIEEELEGAEDSDNVIEGVIVESVLEKGAGETKSKEAQSVDESS